MENYCNACNNHGFSPLDKTWSSDSGAKQGTWNPYSNFAENYYNCQGNSWTVQGNVTPANSPTYNGATIHSQESYSQESDSGKPCQYLTLNQTWNHQKIYEL